MGSAMAPGLRGIVASRVAVGNGAGAALGGRTDGMVAEVEAAIAVWSLEMEGAVVVEPTEIWLPEERQMVPPWMRLAPPTIVPHVMLSGELEQCRWNSWMGPSGL